MDLNHDCSQYEVLTSHVTLMLLSGNVLTKGLFTVLKNKTRDCNSAATASLSTSLVGEAVDGSFILGCPSKMISAARVLADSVVGHEVLEDCGQEPGPFEGFHFNVL